MGAWYCPCRLQRSGDPVLATLAHKGQEQAGAFSEQDSLSRADLQDLLCHPYARFSFVLREQFGVWDVALGACGRGFLCQARVDDRFGGWGSRADVRNRMCAAAMPLVCAAASCAACDVGACDDSRRTLRPPRVCVRVRCWCFACPACVGPAVPFASDIVLHRAARTRGVILQR